MLKLEILTDEEQIARICEGYWRQNKKGRFTLKIKDIADSHGLDPQKVSRLVEKYAFVWLDEIFCTQCKKFYTFSTRKQYRERHSFQNRKCTYCLEENRQAVIEEKKRKIVQMRESAESESVHLERLDIRSVIFLFSTVQALTDDEHNIINPLEMYPQCTLSPDHVYDREIIRHLIDKNILIINFGTSPEVVHLQDDDRFRIDLGKCLFESVFEHVKIKKFTNDFLFETTLPHINMSKIFKEMCKEVQLLECLTYLTKNLEEHQLYMAVDDKTRLVISECLDSFSVAQVYNFIWRAVRYAAAYYMRSSISRDEAANSAIDYISRNMEQALAHGWEIKPYQRIKELPQSSLSRVIFNLVLGTNDGGFNLPLHEILKTEYSKF